MAAQAGQPQSKSAKKKAAKALERTESPAPSVTSASATADKNSSDDSFESPYIKEIQKNIRNVNKKIVRAFIPAIVPGRRC
jgi:carbohydrate-binding DOMON domain-containing protein